MILRPGYFYSFLRVSPSLKTKKDYFGEILSDSWGDGKEAKDRILWDEDMMSLDFWHYDDIYPELLETINGSIASGFEVHIAETVKDHNVPSNDYIVYPGEYGVVKLNHPSLSHFTEADKKLVMSDDPYAQYFVFMKNRSIVEIQKMKGKPYFGDKEWREGDIFLCAMIESEPRIIDGDIPEIELHMVALNQRCFRELYENYLFLRFARDIPVFKKSDWNKKIQ